MIYEIRRDNLFGRATRALLELHLAGMYANSPAENVFALDLTGLKAPGVTIPTMTNYE
jgi:putative acetyltransferase